MHLIVTERELQGHGRETKVDCLLAFLILVPPWTTIWLLFVIFRRLKKLHFGLLWASFLISALFIIFKWKKGKSWNFRSWSIMDWHKVCEQHMVVGYTTCSWRDFHMICGQSGFFLLVFFHSYGPLSHHQSQQGCQFLAVDSS